jgi:hypothetical protein
VIIHNFLSDEECDALLEEARLSKKWKPQNEGTGIFILKSEKHKILIDINKRVSSLFDKDLHAQMIRMIHRTTNDSFWKEHSDDAGGEEIRYGVVLYLNEDFEGGELIYPDLKIEIKPKKGMLVYHPGDEKHRVSKVTSGERYTLTSFIRTYKVRQKEIPGV